MWSKRTAHTGSSQAWAGRLFALAGAVLATGAFPAGVLDPAQWEPVIYCRRPEGNLILRQRWDPEKGVVLAVAPRDGQAVVAVRLNSERLEVQDLQRPPDAAPLNRSTRFYRAHAVADPRGTMEVTVKLRENDWFFYLNGGLVARLPAPVELPADILLPPGDAGRLLERAVFRPVVREHFATDFMVEEGAPNELYPWRIETGNWHLHTAMQEALTRPESDVGRMQQVPLTADKSPNFYSLKGSGKNPDTGLANESIISTGYEFFDDYSYAAAVQVNQGEAGLIFYHTGEGATADYYAFTITMGDLGGQDGFLRLWRVRRGERRNLARAAVPLHLNQWVQPKVVLDGDEIVCSLDDAEVFRVRELLPVGGRIGLYALSTEEVRFDDVKLHSVQKQALTSVGEIRYNTLYQDGAFHRDPGFWRAGTPDGQAGLDVPARRTAQTLVLGRAHNRNAVFEAEFVPRAAPWSVGLVCGFRSPEKPYYRLVVARQGDTESYRLERVRRGSAQTLEHWEQTYPGSSPLVPVRLMADATEEGLLRFCRDGRTVILIPVGEAVVGGAGVTLGAGTAAGIPTITIGFARDRFLEQENKNPVFKEDSFMRHWAAPEGQWLGGEGGLLWHKGDFFSDFTVQLPCVPGSELHALVPEGSTVGALRVGIQGNTLHLRVHDAGQDEPVASYDHTLAPPPGKGVETLLYVLHREGHWVWLSIDGTMVLRHRLGRNPVGTRCRVSGMTLEHVARSKITRVNVIDDFFTESPYKWVANGGDWQIINRFQCTPSWSHMIGESADGLAAFWHKHVFSGNLTVEFYAGSRQGYYERAGDLNCTIMAESTSANSGYTVTCTEFDQNLSQNWSTLFRNGQVVARSDAYLVPRRRAGMVRRLLDPLIAAGRPIHGAWYYVKLRKIGNRIEYHFDNELVFATEDPDPLNSGLVGIWTYMHSMTLAQIKITFEQQRPRDLPVRRLPANPPAPAALPGVSPPAPQWDLGVGGFPVDSLDGAYWTLSDPIGQSRLTSGTMNASMFRVENRLGSGNMHAQPSLPPLPLHQLAGWRFLVKRSPGARLNLYYSLGSVDGKGAFKASRQAFHHLSGDDFGDGDQILSGRSAVGSADNVDRPGGEWELVTAWIPSRLRSVDDGKRGVMVKLDGFGNLHQGRIACGIGGNAPGDAYAIRQLTPIFIDAPRLTGPPDGGVRFALRRRLSGPLLGEFLQDSAVEDLNRRLADLTKPGLNTVWLRAFDRRGRSLHHEIAWLGLPERPALSLTWASASREAVELRHQGEYVDPRLAGAAVRLAGTDLPLEPIGNEEARLARLPRRNGDTPETLVFAVATGGGEATEFPLSWPSAPVNQPPVLLTLEGLESGLGTFEGSDLGRLQMTNDGRITVEHDDPVQGRYIQVRNFALGQQLSASFQAPYSIARFPVMQLRYRAYDMTRLSVGFGSQHYVRLTEDYGAALPVRLAHDLRLDEAWHTWTGIAADAFTQQPFSTARFLPKTITIASAGSPDQTGRYSRWHFDDIVLGPAVASAAQAAFTPRYFDRHGVAAVLAAVLPGATAHPELEGAARAAIQWQTFEPGQPVALSFDGLADGIHHLLYKARDGRGAESGVTSVPFMLDTKPLEPSISFCPYADPAANGVQVTVAFANHGGSPWMIEAAEFHVAGKKQEIPAWTSLFVHSSDSDRLVLNYPFIFRTQLDAAADGDTLEFAIDAIRDGAGNQTPRVAVPIKVDHGSDKTGPAWYYISLDKSAHWWWNWDGYRNTNAAFSPGQYNQVNVVHEAGSSPHLQHLSYSSSADLTRSVSWQPAVHPWIAFRAMQPAYSDRRGVVFRLVLTTTANRTYTLSLTTPSKGSGELNREETIAWTAGQWRRLAFNVRDLLKAAGVSDDEIAKTTINSVNLQRRGTRHQEPLCIDDFHIHGTPADAADDVLKWYAYDASGVAALVVESVDAADKVAWTQELPNQPINLKDLRAKIKGHAWLRCAAKDKAGNLSVPFWLPVAGQ